MHAATRLREAIDAHLWSDEAGAYIDAIHSDGHHSGVISVHTQLFAFLAGVPTGDRRARIESVIVDRPPAWVQIGSPWMSIFLYDALADHGHTAAALADTRHNYGMMLDHDATTCWELFPSSNFTGGAMLTRSHCHAWSAAPAAFFPARLLGVRPLAPGWTKVFFSPEPCGLLNAEGTIPLPGTGCVDIQWHVEENSNRIIGKIYVPAGVTVETRIPQGFDGRLEVVAQATAIG